MQVKNAIKIVFQTLKIKLINKHLKLRQVKKFARPFLRERAHGYI